MITIRPVRPADAAAVAGLRRENQDYLTPWEPAGREESFTEEGVATTIATAIENAEAGMARSHVIVDRADRIVGMVNLNSIIRGAFQSCSLGYWVSRSEAGRGVATESVRQVKSVAFDELGLHRIQGETLVHNLASQIVLERNGFEHYGTAPSYLKIAGRWQDHVLYQVLNPESV